MNIVLIIIIIGIVFWILTCWALIDLIKKDFGALDKKIIWGIVTLIPFVGCILYFTIGYKKGKLLRPAPPT